MTGNSAAKLVPPWARLALWGIGFLGSAVIGTIVGVFLVAVISLSAVLGAQAESDALAGSAACQTTQTATSSLPTTVPEVYRKIFSEAAKSQGAEVKLLTTIFWVEHGRNFPEPPPPYGHGSPWAVSGPGASGPFQFMPLTWAGNRHHVNVDGTVDRSVFADVNDLKDAAYSSAFLLASYDGVPGTPLGDPNNPFAKPTMVNAMASYNAGPAGEFLRWQETRNYVHNGATFYSQLAASPGSSKVQLVSNTTCAKVTNAGLQNKPTGAVLGGSITSSWDRTGTTAKMASSGFPWTIDSKPQATIADGIAVVQINPAKYRKVDAVVVELGGSSSETEATLSGSITKLVASLRVLNPGVSIYWMNFTGSDIDAASRNSTLQRLSVSKGFKVVNWYNLAYPGAALSKVAPKHSQGGWLDGDPLHKVPDTAGTQAIGDLVVRTVSADFSARTTGDSQSSMMNKVIVAPGANLAGEPISPLTTAFLGHIAGLYGKPLVVTTGTNHSIFTVNGNVSDHTSGHGADLGMIANGGTDDSPVGDKMATACLIAAGDSPAVAAQEAHQGGLWTRNHAGLRIQCIWKTNEGGNHHNHLHVGAKKL